MMCVPRVPISIKFIHKVQITLSWLVKDKSHVQLFQMTYHTWVFSLQTFLTNKHPRYVVCVQMFGVPFHSYLPDYLKPKSACLTTREWQSAGTLSICFSVCMLYFLARFEIPAFSFSVSCLRSIILMIQNMQHINHNHVIDYASLIYIQTSDNVTPHLVASQAAHK